MSKLCNEFHVFFNDLVSNGFNTLLTSLPKDRQYFASGVPGTFHDRLFTESSLHFAYTNYTHHLLSKSPEEIQDKDSPAWNKGRIHYTNAPKEVMEAFATQFAEDATNFLGARAKELAPGGMLVITMQEVTSYLNCTTVSLFYYALEVTKLVEENWYLSIQRMELTDPPPWLKRKRHISVPNFITHVRATLEGIFSSHFGDEITDEMFQGLVKQISSKIEELVSKHREKTQLLVVLKRKVLGMCTA
ncbi:hypothetical protein L6164_001208 [Bauhinia variegata]|uniref:Uncharacterized protein n=1 Tax=Bauhinia variegata TaxID=167791 RepID=A0ACB9Q8V6_BAUVA|nr:hypothetical protein L6164_001208 [Bauhinia variegata]